MSISNPPSIFAYVNLLFRVIHDEIKEYSCGVCGYNTSRKRTLDKHMKQVHWDWENVTMPNGLVEQVMVAQDLGQAMKLEQVGPDEIRVNWPKVELQEPHGHVVQPLTN